MMKRLLLVLSIAIGTLLLSPAPEADARGRSQNRQPKRHQAPKKSHAVPELDPSSAGSAVALLLGGVAIVASRRRKEDLV